MHILAYPIMKLVLTQNAFALETYMLHEPL